MGHIHFLGDDPIEDGEGDDRVLTLDLGDGGQASGERAFGDEHIVTRQMGSWHSTRLPLVVTAIPAIQRRQDTRHCLRHNERRCDRRGFW